MSVQVALIMGGGSGPPRTPPPPKKKILTDSSVIHSITVHHQRYFMQFQIAEKRTLKTQTYLNAPPLYLTLYDSCIFVLKRYSINQLFMVYFHQ